MKARRSTSPTKTYKTTERGLEITLEMLKMQIDPAMCMKTKRARQNVMSKTRLFTRKCTYYARIDNNSPGFVTENALAWFIHEWGGVAAASPRRYAESLWLSARSNLIPLAHAARLSRVACARPSEVRLPEKPSLSAEQSGRAAICARLFVNKPG